MDTLINISVKIADRSYPLRIKAEEQDKVKQAAANIEKRLKELMEKYDGRDMQDYMAMYILIMMNESVNPGSSMDEQVFTGHLTALDKQLDELLHNTWLCYLSELDIFVLPEATNPFFHQRTPLFL